MANLPEKNITTVDKITSIPSNTNLYINANGEFRQATIDDVLKASPVITDSIVNQYKNASGSPILLTDSAKGVAIEFNAKGRSTQDGEPTPTEPITPKSNGDMGWFDGELLQGYYATDGSVTSYAGRVSAKNLIPCSEGDNIKLTYEESASALNILYFKDNVWLSQTTGSNVSELSGTVPSGANSFGININNDGITPQTAKHICVTINGKYVLKVKSVGKNLIPYPYRDTTHTDGNAVIWTDNGDGTITANGTDNSKQVQQFYLITDGAMGLEPNTTYILNGCPGVGSLSTYNLRLIINRGLTGSTWIEYRDFGNGVTFTTPSDYKHCSIMIDVLKGTTVSNLLVKPMLRRAEVTDRTYEPYKETVTYIPLNEPLRSSLDGSVKDEVSLSENKVTRRIVRKRIVTVSKNNDTDVNNYCYYCALGNVGRSNGGISNNLPNLLLYEVTINGTENIGQYVSAEYGVVYINVGKHLTENTVEGMTKWLSENPTYIQYELAEPVVETIEPVDIVTYDNVTYISNADNVEMELEYPTSKVAGIASIGWSKGRRAEYDLEQLKAQMLALQTTIVSTV